MEGPRSLCMLYGRTGAAADNGKVTVNDNWQWLRCPLNTRTVGNVLYSRITVPYFRKSWRSLLKRNQVQKSRARAYPSWITTDLSSWASEPMKTQKPGQPGNEVTIPAEGSDEGLANYRTPLMYILGPFHPCHRSIQLGNCLDRSIWNEWGINVTQRNQLHNDQGAATQRKQPL